MLALQQQQQQEPPPPVPDADPAGFFLLLAPRPALLLLGPAGSGRSALSFRAALLGASSSARGRALFLAPRPLERLPAGGASATGAIQRIHFLYPPSFRELLQLVASLHETFSCSLTLVVLDGLEEYLGSCSSPAMATQLVALLLDTANHFSQKRTAEDSAAGCKLVVSMRLSGDAGEEGEYFSAVERYFPAQCWLHPSTEEIADSGRQGTAKLIRARLLQPGTKDQEWLVEFDQQGDMRISQLPCKGEGDACTISGSNRPREAEAHSLLDSLS